MSEITKSESEVALVKLFLNGELSPDLPEEYIDDIPTLLRCIQAKIAYLTKAVRKYGHHTPQCFSTVSFGMKCNCGFAETIREVNNDGC